MFLNNPCVPSSEALDLGTITVQIIVGGDDNRDTFVAHKNILCARSAFCQRMLNGDWKEAKEGVAKLAEDDPTAFSLYINFAYTGKIPCITPDDAPSHMKTLCKLYLLCEELQDLEAKNAVTEGILARARAWDNQGWYQTPGPGQIKAIYEGTPGSCGLRRLLADFYAYRLKSPDWLRKHGLDEYPKEFLWDISLAALQQRHGSLKDITLAGNGSQYLDPPPTTKN